MSRASHRVREIDPEIGSIYGDFGIADTALEDTEKRLAGGRNASEARNQSPPGVTRGRQ